MIIDFILNLIYNFIVWVLNLLPEVSFSDNVNSSITTASGYISAVNSIAPVGVLLQILSVFIVVEGTILIIKIVNWFIRKIPAIS